MTRAWVLTVLLRQLLATVCLFFFFFLRNRSLERKEDVGWLPGCKLNIQVSTGRGTKIGELFSYPEPVPPDLLQQVAKPTKLIAHVFFLMQIDAHKLPYNGQNEK